MLRVFITFCKFDFYFEHLQYVSRVFRVYKLRIIVDIKFLYEGEIHQTLILSFKQF